MKTDFFGDNNDNAPQHTTLLNNENKYTQHTCVGVAQRGSQFVAGFLPSSFFL